MQDNMVRLHDGRNLGFSEYGKPEGIPLLLFHGTPGSRVFKQFENASWIEESGLRVITPERPGYGLSDPSPGRTISDWARDVEDLADYLGVDRFHVAGGSGGGPYALACGIHLPERVLSVTLFCSGCPPEVMRLSKDMQFGNRLAFLFAKYAPFLVKRLLAAQANAVKKQPKKFAAKLIAQFPELDKRLTEKHLTEEQKIERVIKPMKEAYRQGVEGAYRDMLLVARPWGLDLDKISVPVFLWHGTADTMMPVSFAREFSELIPGCEPHFIPDIGHQLLANEEVRSQMIARMLSVSASCPAS